MVPGRRDVVVGAVGRDDSGALLFSGGDTVLVQKLTGWSYGTLAQPVTVEGMPGLTVASPQDVRKWRREREGRDPGRQRLHALLWSMADKDVVLQYWEAGEWHSLDLGDD